MVARLSAQKDKSLAKSNNSAVSIPAPARGATADIVQVAKYWQFRSAALRQEIERDGAVIRLRNGAIKEHPALRAEIAAMWLS